MLANFEMFFTITSIMKSIKFLFILNFLILISFTNFSQVREYWPTKDWEKKTPGELNIDTVKLHEMDELILSMPYIDAFLIVKNGYLVYEKYYNQYNESKYHIICSSTKSVTNVLMGILLKQKYIESLNQKVIDFFPEYGKINNDSRINDITIEHTMTYTTGISAGDNSTLNQSDMIEFYLSCNFLYNPGTHFKYATPASQIQSAIISKTTGKNAKSFADQELFSKLGIVNYYWPADAQGYTYGGYISYYCPRDMLKIGFLYLNNGIWDSDTIVEPEFVKNSTAIHSSGGTPHNEKYGYNWWITENNGYKSFFAGGYGGQFIYVIPDLDIVVAITCNTNSHRENARFLINSHVVPAIISTNSVGNNAFNNKSKFYMTSNLISNEIEIEFELNKDKPVSILIYDQTGKKIEAVFENEIFNAGKHNYNYEHHLKNGYYILKANIGSEVFNSRILISKPD